MRIRVNGKSLMQEIGNRITLFGTVTKVGSNQMGIELTTTDHVKVNVSLPHPFTGAPGDGIEVHGIAKSKTTVSADGYVCFSAEELEKFDSEQFNDFVILLKYKLGHHNGLKEAFHVV